MLARFDGTPPCPVNVDPDVAAVNPAKLPEPVPKCRLAHLSIAIVCTCLQDANTAHTLALLRPSTERPRRCRAAEQHDELPPLHSITSSARAISDGGTVRPSVLAVLRLITSSYLVGACTGRSAGFP